jgi:hypothetical protein
MTYIIAPSAMAFLYRGATVERTSFRVHDPNTVASEVRSKLAILDRATFRGRRATDSDTATLDNYIDTLQAQAHVEQWRDVAFTVYIGGKQAVARYSIEYTAKTASGSKVNGGGTIVVDRPAVTAFLRSLN